MSYPNLFQPIQIGNMTVKNRIAMSPMTLRAPDTRRENGTASDRLIYFWETRAKGGAGLIITDVLTPDPEYQYHGPTLMIHNDAQFASMQKLVNAIHRHGAKIVPQLSHPGPGSMRALLSGKEVVGPSDDVNTQLGNLIRELSIPEIEKIVEQFGETAKRAREACFDGVELHCGHAYMLLGSFLSPLRNKRTDKYGGKLEGRVRLPVEVIRSVKEKAGGDFPVIIRMSGDEVLEDGNHVKEMIYAARCFAQAGADALEISGGAYPEVPECVMACQGLPDALNSENAAQIRCHVDIPVLTVGGVRSPAVAEHLIATGKVDMVVMGRALLADPELPAKALRGDTDSIAPCIGCSDGCLGAVSVEHATCVINPLVGEELEMEITEKTDSPKKVLVVGGGPAGLMAARDCALIGHHVTLLEKEKKLGGLLHAACRAPLKQEVSDWVKYLIHEVERLGADIRLSTPCSSALLDEFTPDVVIAATGSTEIVPNIPGLDTANVTTAVKVLTGKEMVIAGNVLVIGGGIVGLETADVLAQSVQPISITVVEMLDEVGAEYYAPKKKLIMRRLERQGVNIITSAKVVQVGEIGVIAEVNGMPNNLGKFDHIVLACGFAPNHDAGLYADFAGEVITIGDAVKSRSAMEAIAEGAKAARQIGI